MEEDYLYKVKQMEKKCSRLENWCMLYIVAAFMSFLIPFVMTCYYKDLLYITIGCVFITFYICMFDRTHKKLEDNWHKVSSTKYTSYKCRKRSKSGTTYRSDVEKI